MAGKLPLLQNDPARLIFLSSLRSWSATVLMSASLMRGLFRPMDMMKYYQVVRCNTATTGPGAPKAPVSSLAILWPSL